jgi:hypothetical protein
MPPETRKTAFPETETFGRAEVTVWAVAVNPYFTPTMPATDL